MESKCFSWVMNKKQSAALSKSLGPVSEIIKSARSGEDAVLVQIHLFCENSDRAEVKGIILRGEEDFEMGRKALSACWDRVKSKIDL